jgi:hypothetical protein
MNGWEGTQSVASFILEREMLIMEMYSYFVRVMRTNRVCIEVPTWE